MIKLDKITRTISKDGIAIELTRPQWDILSCFSQTDGVTIEKVAQRVYGSQVPKNRTAASVTVSRIKNIVGSTEFIVKYRGLYVLHEDIEVIE